jgi:hypothetical protein
MNESLQPRKKNYVRRAIGVALCFAPPAVLIASLVAGLSGKAIEHFAGIWFLVPAGLLGSVNSYLSFVRWRLWLRRHGSRQGYHHVSGIPLLGSLLVLVASIVGFGAIGTSLFGIVISAFDTGGSPWFLIATWHDSSFWD